jgi:N-acetylmuramoyl-L-alanine amidase
VFFTIPTYSFASDVTNKRLGGQDRFKVAVNVSKQGWATSDTVILANIQIQMS